MAGKVAVPAARIGGALGEAAGGFTGGFAHGARHGWVIGREQYASGAIGRAISSGIKGYDKGAGRIALKAIEAGPSSDEAPADRAKEPARQLSAAPTAATATAAAASSGGQVGGGHSASDEQYPAAGASRTWVGGLPPDRAGAVARRSDAAMSHAPIRATAMNQAAPPALIHNPGATPQMAMRTPAPIGAGRRGPAAIGGRRGPLALEGRQLSLF